VELKKILKLELVHMTEPLLSHAGKYGARKRYFSWDFSEDLLQGLDDTMERRDVIIRKAELGDPGDQFLAGLMYAHGLGGGEDFVTAVSWFRKSAAQGNPDAQFYLAVAYETGDGVSRDLDQALSWYEKAEEQGHGAAASNLGVASLAGRGVEKNLSAAIGYFFSAYMFLDSTEGMNNWGVLLQTRKRDNLAAEKLYRLAAHRGCDEAQFNLGTMITKDPCVRRTRGEGKMWLTMSAEQGNSIAMAVLGLMYALGTRGPKKKYVEAYAWLSLAIERGVDSKFRSYLSKIEARLSSSEKEDAIGLRKRYRRNCLVKVALPPVWFGGEEN
jgi:TPR repeat protein